MNFDDVRDNAYEVGIMITGSTVNGYSVGDHEVRGRSGSMHHTTGDPRQPWIGYMNGEFEPIRGKKAEVADWLVRQCLGTRKITKLKVHQLKYAKRERAFRARQRRYSFTLKAMLAALLALIAIAVVPFKFMLASLLVPILAVSMFF